MTEAFDIPFLQKAYVLAQYSPDPSTQNGAVLVRNGLIIGQGYNGFFGGVQNKEDRLVRPRKYLFVEHAERACLFDAATRNISLAGATLYCPWFACADCARAIIQLGVRKVVGHNLDLHKASHWGESISAAFEMFDETGVEYRFVDHVFDIQIRFNGELIDV